MSKVAIVTGVGEPEFSSNKGLIHAFRSLGHEVFVVGIPYWGRYDADALIPDRKHPELVPYSEALEKLPWTPDIMGCLEPHGFLTGPKPPQLTSFFYCTDPHAAGKTYYQIVQNGNFNVFFCGQPYFSSLFRDMGTRIETVLPGFDERRFPELEDNGPVADISFIGYSGIAGMEYPLKDENGRYATKPPITLPPNHMRYASHGQPSFDYAERAEILIRLCRNFKVRIYDSVWETPNFMQALRTGAIVFNKSLLNDINIRIFEALAAGRTVITDEVPCVANWQPELEDLYCSFYSLHYRPFYENFSLDYQQIYRIVTTLLDSSRARISAKEFRRYAFAHHSWKNRAERILNLL